jgi:hypothetical protein
MNSPVAIYAYGSLLVDPGEHLRERIVEGVCFPSPWPIEYARTSSSRGGAPTLTIHSKGAPVQGKLLVLDPAVTPKEAEQWLWEREGRPCRQAIKRTALGTYQCVFYCALAANIADEELTPDHLAELAVASVAREPERNGIRYLRECVGCGIHTPLTSAYVGAVLRRTRASDLVEAERMASS